MDVKAGYKQTEVGVFPVDWRVKSLESLSEKIMVGIASAATHAYREKGVPMFRNQNIKVGHLDDRDLLFVAPEYEVAFKNKRLRPGDLLTMRTGYPGVTAIVPAQYDSSQSFTTLITRPDQSRVESAYLCHLINSEHGQRFFTQSQIGGAQKNVNAGTLRGMPVPLPSVPEQRAIAAALSDVDALLGGLERLIAKKRDLKQADMQQLLTGHTRLPGHSGAWEVKRLGERIIRLRKTNRPSAAGRSVGKYPFFTNSTKPCDKYLDECDFDTEAIIANTGGEAFFNYFNGPFAAMADCLVLESRLVTRFLYFLLKTLEQRINETGFTGSGIKHLDKRYFADIEINLPPTETEQVDIAAVLSDMDAELAALEARRDKTRDLKQAMMQDLLTGRTRLVTPEAAHA